MKVIEKYGKTEDEALQAALKEAGIEKNDDVKYEVFQESHKSGFLGMGSNKNIKVKLFVYEEDEKKIFEVLREMFKYMDITIDEIKIKERKDERIFIDIKTPDAAVIIGRRGKTLEAIQFILSLIVSKILDKNLQIILDVGKYRDKRVRVLEKLAKNLALKVRKFKRPVVLEPMNPYERRIIHSTLQNEKDIVTQSIGAGIYKKVKIMLKK